MSNDGLALFDLAERRLGWIDRRQAVLAQNIANASTPGYSPKDLQPFAAALARVTPQLATTQAGHLGTTAPGVAFDQGLRPSERAPDGNAVSVEEQLTKVADTDGAQALVVNIYHAYLGLFRTVIGK